MRLDEIWALQFVSAVNLIASESFDMTYSISFVNLTAAMHCESRLGALAQAIQRESAVEGRP